MSAARIDDETLTKVVGYLKEAKSILFITGAGISADSGLPTYRGIGGLYNNRDTEEDIPIEVALSGDMLIRRPELTWKYISQIEAASRGSKYNRGHEVIAEIERHFDRVWVLTQNVDGFHRDAGSEKIIDIHGDVHFLMCTACDYSNRVTDYAGLDIPPKCPKCSSAVRPDVVFFGEMLPLGKVNELQAQLTRGFDLIFTIGTSSLFPYIAQPVIRARWAGTPTVEINPGDTHVSEMVDIKIAAGAAAALDAIWKRFND